MPPMSRHSTIDHGCPSQELADYYIRRARAGVGLIIIEAASIDDNVSLSYVGGLQFHNKTHVEAWRPIVKELQEAGAKVIIQLYHAGRLTNSEIAGTCAIAPSPLRHFPQKSHLIKKDGDEYVHFQTRTKLDTPREMTIDDIDDVQKKFSISAQLTVEAGLDGIELHGAHGYLIHQFNSTVTNKREDEYGMAGLEFKFATELAAKCRQSISAEKILSYRLSLHMVDLPFARYSKEEMDIEALVKRLENHVDIFNCSEMKAGNPMFGADKSLSEEVRSCTQRSIITCGGIGSVAEAEKLLNSGSSDMIAYGRALLANSEYIKMLGTDNFSDFKEYNSRIHDAIIY